MSPRPIFVAATKQHVGKTSVSLSLMSGLKKRFKKVGFIKPVGQEVRGGFWCGCGCGCGGGLFWSGCISWGRRGGDGGRFGGVRRGGTEKG